MTIQKFSLPSLWQVRQEWASTEWALLVGNDDAGSAAALVAVQTAFTQVGVDASFRRERRGGWRSQTCRQKDGSQ